VGSPSAGEGALPIGVAIGTIGATPEWWLESARRLETAGYRGVWAWDHFVGGGDKTVPVVEQWTILAATAGATTRLRVGTFVTNVMNRHPAVVARMASTLQAASGGRLSVGIGVGGNKAEHAAYGIEFPEIGERADRLEEAVQVIRELWRGGPVTRPSAFFPLDAANAYPVPRPAPPLLIGAASPRGLRIAASHADGWAAEVDDFERLLPTYVEALAAAGKSRADAWIAVGFGSGRSGQNALDGSAWVSRPSEEWARWRAAGADEVILPARTPADIDALVRAAEGW
jgi:alkanesulfonate monooxygenase SsuD/methylene tetrahydromethanopterin reductase-like flavin-dependent oxidoreductase (luciferase family)